MIPILCLALAAQGPRIEGARGRVLLFDAESGARRIAGHALHAAEDGVLETGAASSVRLSIQGRMALTLEGPASLEWRAERQHLLRVAKARWDWRGSRAELGLPRGWSLRGGPGAYELEAEPSGYLLRNLAGAPIEVLDGDVGVLVVPAGGSARFSPPQVEVARPAAWDSHAWPWQASAVGTPPEPRHWWPAAFACADVLPARMRTSAESSVVESSVHPASMPRLQPAPHSGEPQDAEPHVDASHVDASHVGEPRHAERGGWPDWLRARVQALHDALFDRIFALRSWLARWQALHAFGVAFDPLAPFEVRIEDDRLELRLSPRAGRAERVRGTSTYLMQPGSAIVLARGGRLLSHAGDVEVRARAR